MKPIRSLLALAALAAVPSLHAIDRFVTKGVDYDAGDTPIPETLMQDEALGRLEVLLRALPARQREAFMLRNFEGMDVAETATAMGCSTITAWAAFGISTVVIRFAPNSSTSSFRLDAGR